MSCRGRSSDRSVWGSLTGTRRSDTECLSPFADACTTRRATPALVQTTVNIQMLKVACTIDASAAELFRRGIVLRALRGYWEPVQRRQLLWRVR